MTINKIPEKLLHLLNPIELDDTGGLIIESITYNFDCIKVIYSVYTSDDVKNQVWELQINDFKAEKVILDWASSINIYSDHILLWEYSDFHTELYFRKKAENPDKLLADIYKIHKAIMGDWLDVEKYILSLSNLITENSCLFAKGPKKVLEYYFKCLYINGTEPYYFGETKPKKLGKNGWELEDSDCKLITIGQSFFIGREFVWTQI